MTNQSETTIWSLGDEEVCAMFNHVDFSVGVLGWPYLVRPDNCDQASRRERIVRDAGIHSATTGPREVAVVFDGWPLPAVPDGDSDGTGGVGGGDDRDS